MNWKQIFDDINDCLNTPIPRFAFTITQHDKSRRIGAETATLKIFKAEGAKLHDVVISVVWNRMSQIHCIDVMAGDEGWVGISDLWRVLYWQRFGASS